MKVFYLVFFFFTILQSTAQINTTPEASDIAWIKTVLRNWGSVSNNVLYLRHDQLPWIIFYDSAAGWHLNPEEKLLPAHTKTFHHFHFAGKEYNLYKVDNTHDLWVPERQALSISALPNSTMPYDNNNKTFFIAPLPSLFHHLAPPDQHFYLDLLFLGLCCHELTHTLQLPVVLPQLLKMQQDYNMPQSIDDNIIENTFGKNNDYIKLFNEEKEHLGNAVFTLNNDTCKIEISKALALQRERALKFFAGDSIGYRYLDEIFLSLEGSAMWVQFQVTLGQAPKDQSWQQTFIWLAERTASWSQAEGLGLFILIDRFVPDWKSRFFKKELLSPFQLLTTVVSN